MSPAHPALSVDPSELEFHAIRAQGPGGQNVNKVSSAIQLRFDIAASSLPEAVRTRLLALSDRRISDAGWLVIKAQSFRTQEANRADALRRLQELINSVAEAPKTRRPTRPTYGSQQRRLQGKAKRAEVKAGRGRIDG